MIDHSLRELMELAALIPAAPIADGPLAIQQLDGAAPMAGAKPKNRTNKQRDAETAWDRRLCEMIARGEQPDTRDKVKAIAQNEFGALLSDRAFERVWAHRATPEMKKPGPRGSRKSPQS